MDDKEDYDYIIKYIVLGNAAVGKSNIIVSFIKNEFNLNYKVTLGIDCETKIVTIENTKLYLQIWDTAGSESFYSITRSFFKNTTVVVVVYDVTNKNTFHSVKQWLRDCQEENNEHLIKVLVANKIDKPDNIKQVTSEEGHELAEKEGMLFIESSVKTRTNIENIFLESAKIVVQNIKNNVYDLSTNVNGIKTKQTDDRLKNVELTKFNSRTKGYFCCY